MRFLPFLLLHVYALAAEPSYIGSQKCAACHRISAEAQGRSNMARTWRTPSAFAANYEKARQEGALQYAIARHRGELQFHVRRPGVPPFDGVVESVVGGPRHGLSFLVRVPALGGIPLARAPLVEARYLHSSSTGELVLSPGFPQPTPENWETAVGRALSPGFEKKCLNCHGAADQGVRCESCHGPGSAHLQAVAAKSDDKAIVNPARFSNSQKMEQCGQCHAGFSELSDPVPDDVLISNQVTALRNSQCYIQSGEGLNCTSCHDPHRDSRPGDTRPVTVCLSCHSIQARNRAGLCPVNKSGDCLKCHMPQAEKGAFHMVDHWIRVHPEQGVKVARRASADHTTIAPKHYYLRWIVAASVNKAEAARSDLLAGAAFFDVAQKYSSDSSAISGGFLGNLPVGTMDPALVQAALPLQRGESSGIVDIQGKPTIVYRMPRDFLYDAEQRQLEATRLREQGEFGKAAKKYLESLQIYPYYLRSLIFLAVSVGEGGEGARAASILELAASLYPKDPAAQYNLGIAYGSLNRTADEIRTYRQAIDLQPDLIPAYMNLGGTLYAAGRLDEAAEAYRSGLQQNPLAASLYFNLAQVYRQQGKTAEAVRAAALARTIDPRLAKDTQ